jgi:hypothetical protein
MSALPPPAKVRFTLPQDIAAGVYSNYVGIDSGPHDYTLTFYQLIAPTQDRREEIEGRAVCRVTISPTLLDPLIAALQSAKSQREKLTELIAKGEQAG